MNRLKLLRNNLQLSMKECAAKIGIPYTTYVNYEKGLREPNSEMLVMLSDFFNVSVDYLIGRSESKEKNEPSSIPPGLELLPPMKKIPLLGDIACGEPILAEQNITDYIEIPGHIHADYALTCHGDSMVGAGIHDGDLVYIRQQPTVENGQIAAVLVDGEEATLKRVYLDRGAITISPANPKYPPKSFSGEAASRVQVIGRAVAYIHIIRD